MAAVINVRSTPPSAAQERAVAEGLAKLTLTYALARRGDADAVARIASIRAAADAGDARAQAAWRFMGGLHTKAEAAHARWQRSYGVAARAVAGDPDAAGHIRRVVRKASAGDAGAKAEADRIGCMVGRMTSEPSIAVGWGPRRGLNGWEGMVVGKSLSTAEHAELMDLMQRAIDSIPNWRLFVQSGLGAGSSSGSPKAGSFADAYLTSHGAVSNYTKPDGTINKNALMINRMF